MGVLYLAPFVEPDLQLSHSQVALLAPTLALDWGASAGTLLALLAFPPRRVALVGKLL